MTLSFFAGANIRRIYESLPREETEHMRRVGILVGILSQKLHAHAMGLKSSDDTRYFGQAAAYHDIGKAWVPKSILIKPDRLTEEEMGAMRKHPEFAQKWFEQNAALPGVSRQLWILTANSAVYHHEWWNGTGYPYGIRSYSIPLVARVTSVCDAYDAITSDRPYRKARTHYYACRELEKNAGAQFDPALVRAFLENEQEISVCLNKSISCL